MIYEFDWSSTASPQRGYVEIRTNRSAVEAMLRARREVRKQKLPGLDLARIIVEQRDMRPEPEDFSV